MINEIKMKTQINELTKENLNLKKENTDLNFLIGSQDRLIKKLKKQNEEYVLLLDECLKKEKRI